jgi:hypothetical protein
MMAGFKSRKRALRQGFIVNSQKRDRLSKRSRLEVLTDPRVFK